MQHDNVQYDYDLIVIGAGSGGSLFVKTVLSGKSDIEIVGIVDADPNKFLLGMLNLFKSENGGTTYTRWGGYACDSCTPYYRHPDHQDILINGNDHGHNGIKKII